MKLMRVASIALAAYFVNSAEPTSMCSILSRWRLNGAYSWPIRARARSPAGPGSVPMTIRSGRMKSSTAAPSLRNSGLETTAIGVADNRATTGSPAPFRF